MGFVSLRNKTPVRYRKNNMLEPVGTTSGEFDEEILSDLIGQNFSGVELLRKFKEARRKIRPAVEKLIAEADMAAHGTTEYATYNEIFGAKDVL